eukprot:5505243-Amphidinium_carterae.1
MLHGREQHVTSAILVAILSAKLASRPAHLHKWHRSSTRSSSTSPAQCSGALLKVDVEPHCCMWGTMGWSKLAMPDVGSKCQVIHVSPTIDNRPTRSL